MNSFISVEEGFSGYELDDLIFSASSISGSSVHSGCKSAGSQKSAISKNSDLDNLSKGRRISLKGLSTPEFINSWLSLNKAESDYYIEDLLSQQDFHWMFSSETESDFDGFSDASGASFEGFCNNRIEDILTNQINPFLSSVNKRRSTRNKHFSKRSLPISPILDPEDSVKVFSDNKLEIKTRQNCSKNSLRSLHIPSPENVSKETEKEGGGKGKDEKEGLNQSFTNRKSEIRNVLKTSTPSRRITRSSLNVEPIKEIKQEVEEFPLSRIDTDDEVLFEGFTSPTKKPKLLTYAKDGSSHLEEPIGNIPTSSKVIVERSLDLSDFIGPFCDSVGCTISWLESEECMEDPISVINGIVYELNEFSKKIAWEPFYVARWILRLRGHDSTETSDDDLKKIHLLLKRRKALSVTLAGRNSLKQKMTSFDTGEFSLPSAENLDNIKDSLLEQAECEIVDDSNKYNGISFGKIMHHLINSDTNKSAKDGDDTCVDNSEICDIISNKSESDIDRIELTKSVDHENDPRHNGKSDPAHNLSSLNENNNGNIPAIESGVKENFSKRPYFDDPNELIGNHCKAQVITPQFLNLPTTLSNDKVIITNGIVYELYNFYRKKGATLTSLVHTLYALKALPFTRISVISTMAKIHELVKVLWREKILENPDMPYEEFNLPCLKNISSPASSVDKDEFELLPYDEGKAKPIITASIKMGQSKELIDKNIQCSPLSDTKSNISSKKSVTEIKESDQELSADREDSEKVGDHHYDEVSTKLPDLNTSNADKNISVVSPNVPIDNIPKSTMQENSDEVESGILVNQESRENLVDKISSTQNSNLMDDTCENRHQSICDKNTSTNAFDLNKTRGGIGQISRGDIVFLYTRWLKKKIEGTSIFVTDLSNDLENLIKERNVVSIRIPVGTLMSSSVKLFEKFREISKEDESKANEYLLGDWLSDVQKIRTKRRNTSDTMPPSDLIGNNSTVTGSSTSICNSPQIPENLSESEIPPVKPKKMRKKGAKRLSVDSSEKLDSSEPIANGTNKLIFPKNIIDISTELKNKPRSDPEIAENLENRKLILPNSPKKRSTSTPVKDNDQQNYKVDKIVGYRIVKVDDKSITEYRVRWSWLSSNGDTWVAESDLKCPDALYQFWNALHKQRALKGITEESVIKDGKMDKLDKLLNYSENIPPFVDERNTSSHFFKHFISKLKCDLINYRLESDDENFPRRIKVTKGEVLDIYDRWRENYKQNSTVPILRDFKSNLKLFKAEVKDLMEDKKVRNFNSSCLIDCCYRMSLMRSKCSNKKAVEEYLNGDFLELMKSSQKHLDFIRKENDEKCASYRKDKLTSNANEKENGQDVEFNPVAVLNSLEKEMFLITNDIKNKNHLDIPKIMKSFNGDRQCEKTSNIEAIKRQNQSTIELLNVNGLGSEALEDIIEMLL